MTVKQVFERVANGKDDCAYQLLHEAMTNISTNKRGESTISFKSKELTATHVATDSDPVLGIVLWIPRDWLKEEPRG